MHILNVVLNSDDKHANDVDLVQIYHQKKVNMIGYADTVIEPWTVMIHSLDAPITHVAVF